MTLTSSSGTDGIQRITADRQANLIELGHTMSKGHFDLYALAIPRDWIVFPNPMSSANKIRPPLFNAYLTPSL